MLSPHQKEGVVRSGDTAVCVAELNGQRKLHDPIGITIFLPDWALLNAIRLTIYRTGCST